MKNKVNPSPSNDHWFDDEENMNIVDQGIMQLKNFGGGEYTAVQLKERIGA